MCENHFLGILCAVNNTLCGDRICPFVRDLVSATKPRHVFMKFTVRVLHQKLSSKHELCVTRHCTYFPSIETLCLTYTHTLYSIMASMPSGIWLFKIPHIYYPLALL